MTNETSTSTLATECKHRKVWKSTNGWHYQALWLIGALLVRICITRYAGDNDSSGRSSATATEYDPVEHGWRRDGGLATMHRSAMQTRKLAHDAPDATAEDFAADEATLIDECKVIAAMNS